MGEPTFAAYQGPTPTTPTAKPSTTGTSTGTSTSSFTPEELPFTDLDSYSTSPTRESWQYLRRDRNHQRASYNSPRFHLHSYRAARQIERLSRSLDRQNIRQQDAVRNAGLDQSIEPASSCSQPLLVNEVLPGRRTGPGISTIDIYQKSTEDPLSCFPGAFAPTPRGEVRYRLLSSHQITSQAAQPKNTGYIEPDDYEEDLSGDSILRQRVGLTDQIPFNPIEIGDEDLDMDEGFFDDPNATQLDGRDDTNPISPRTLVRQGLLPFRRSAQAAANCSVVVHNVPRMRKRRKRERRREAASTTAAGQSTTPSTTRFRIEASC